MTNEELQKRIQELEFRLNSFSRPSTFTFAKDLVLVAGKKLGLFGVVPVNQPSSTGEADGVTVGTGTALTHTATFTGDTGTTAYTISDVVKHLKNIGLLLK